MRNDAMRMVYVSSNNIYNRLIVVSALIIIIIHTFSVLVFRKILSENIVINIIYFNGLLSTVLIINHEKSLLCIYCRNRS